jgi:hypothetical protein
VDEEARVVWCVHAVDGEVRLLPSPRGVRASDVAAAVIFNVCCGWDESEVIRVLVGDQQFEARPRFEDAIWRVFIDGG